MTIYLDRLRALRMEMRKNGIAAYLIPSSDPHISEYLPERYKAISWLSGFTGSAGTLLITENFAGLWTDSRYFVQAVEQLEGSGFELVKLKVQGAPEFADWIKTHLEKGSMVAYDGKTASQFLASTLEHTVLPAGIQVRGDVDLLDQIWKDRPALPTEKAYLLSSLESGQSASDKLLCLRRELQSLGADYHVVSSLDDLAWILNIRGNDVACNPVALGFLLLSESDATLFIDPNKIDPRDQAELRSHGVEIEAYDQVWEAVSMLEADKSILFDPKRTCQALYSKIPSTVKCIEKLNPSTRLKAIKNEQEIASTRDTMILDGIALTRFFRWLEEEVKASNAQSEISISEKLREFRAEQPGFVGESFDTIAGYLDHGALPHYKATESSNAWLKKQGLLLIDSGGQYRGGTTDITRVISLGEIQQQEKIDYTLVLRGMIEGSMAIFPQNTRGYQIDALTRKPLWDNYRNYGHGTGHGVGFFLNVHEGPQVFNTAPIDIAIQPGMITSIEPGIYREGQYGIRIENLVLSKNTEANYFGQFMEFETLTLCYIETALIERDLLEQKHIDWLNSYHATVYARLAPGLDEGDREWLKEKTKSL